MITLIIVKNPFEPWNGRETRKIVAGCTVGELLQTYALPGVETAAVVNGHESADYYVTQPEDFVVLCPVVGKSGGGKQILALVLSIALSFAAIGAGNAAMVNAINGVGKVWKIGSYLAAMGTMFVGNLLIGRLTAQKADMGSYGDNNPTYTWGDIQTMVGQNNPIALTYGTVMSGGQSIGKYVDTLDNDEYLNWLVAAGEGPLEISDITLNDNDIDNFDSVEYEIRSGTNTQELISNFNDTYFTKGLDYQLTDSARVDEAQGNATEGLIVKLEFPGGLFHVNSQGKYKTAWVKVRGDYRLGESGEWIPFVSAKAADCEYVTEISGDAVNGTYRLQVVDTSEYDSHTETEIVTTTATVTYPDSTVLTKTVSRGQSFKLGYFTILVPVDEESQGQPTINETFTVSDEGAKISSNKSSALRKEFRIDNLTPGKYYVRMEVTERSHALTNTKASVRCYWSGLTSIVYDDFCYPNIALIGIRAKATDQLNGSPTLKFKKHNPGIWVWDPYAEEYVQKASDNPAWACYDALHLCRELEEVNNRDHFVFDVGGVAAGRMLYDRFSEWAEFCDEENLKVNIEINQAGEMLDVINQKIAPIGHGKVIRLGTKYGCTWDCKKQPVQMFGMGNIKAGTFQEQFLPTNDRANAVELTYMDAENNFNRETITILADDYDTAAEVKMAQATFDGITSYEQAYREGKYQLYCNKYRLRTVSFEADIDSISCTIGDMVLVAHDVPKWAHSGRIYEVKGDELLLPVELEDATKSYRLMYRTVNDNLYTVNCDVLENKDGWCRIRIETFNPEDPPQRHDIFDLAERNVGSKPFVIQNISRAKDFDRKIECIEYDERIYNEDYDIPSISYHEDDMRPKNVTNVSARSYHYVNSDGVTRQHLDVTWQRASTGTFVVSVYNEDSGWSVVADGISQNSISFDLDVDATQVRIVTVQGVAATTGTVADITAIDSLVMVMEIENLNASIVLGDDEETVVLTWNAIDTSVLKAYVVTFSGTEYRTVNNRIELGGVADGTYVAKVKAQAINGTYGNEASITVTVDTVTDTSVAYKKTVPSDVNNAKLKKLCGRTIVWNQQSVDDSTLPTGTVSGITVTLSNHVFTFKGTTSSALTINFRPSGSFYANHVYVVALKTTNAEGKGGNIRVYDTTHSTNIINTSTGTGLRMFTATQDFTGRYYINCGTGVQLDCTITPLFFDLTEMFGQGNEPATVDEFKVMFPASYYGYSAGALLNAGVTSIVSKSGNTTLATYNIPSYVQALQGYGWSTRNVYNYVDLETKRFVQNVGSRAYASGDESDSTVITDKITTYYVLSAPGEIDISQYLINSNIIDAEAGGTLTFANQNGNNYLIPVPSEVAYR